MPAILVELTENWTYEPGLPLITSMNNNQVLGNKHDPLYSGTKFLLELEQCETQYTVLPLPNNPTSGIASARLGLILPLTMRDPS